MSDEERRTLASHWQTVLSIHDGVDHFTHIHCTPAPLSPRNARSGTRFNDLNDAVGSRPDARLGRPIVSRRE